MSSTMKSTLAGGDLIQQHPPERGKRNDHHLVLYSGCSCCCCCLHTVGGMIGAAVVGNYLPEAVESNQSKVPPKPLPSGQRMFWDSFLWATLSVLVLDVVISTSLKHDPLSTLIIFVMFGPLWLLGTSTIAAMQILVRIPPQLQRGYWRHLGKVILGMLVGSFIGGLVTLPLFF